MKFKKLTLHNFMSYKDATLVLENRGLTLIEGQKNGIPTFSNGSGKTNLLEAILWCLWGSLYSKKLAANDVVFEYKNDCFVSLEIDNFVVTRYRKHKKFKNELHLTVDGKDFRGAKDEETQTKINKLLESNFEAFSQSVFLGQGVLKSFASATETERKVILENLLGNEHYQEILKTIVSPKLGELKEKLEDFNDDIELINEEKKKLEARLEYLQEKHRVFEKEKYVKVEELKAKLNITSLSSPDSLTSAEIEAKIAEKEVEIKQYEALLSGIEKIESTILQETQQLTRLEAKKEHLEEEIHRLENQLRAPIVSLLNKPCTTCGKIVVEEDISRYKNTIQEKINALKATPVVGLKPLRISIENKKEEKQKLLVFRKKISELRTEIEKLRTNLAVLLKAEENERANKLKIKTQLEEVINSKSNYLELIQKEENSLRETQQNLEKIERQRTLVQEELPYWETYENIFSRTGRQELPSLPSLKLDNIIPQLTEGTNRRLRELDSDLTAEFDTTSVTQRGKATDKFSIVVKNKYGADVYGGNSGGERKMIDIAIMLALGEIVGHRNRKQISILLLDELLGTLDPNNAESVMNLLRNEAKTKDSVFVTTLSPEFSAMFENKIIVNKVGKISHLIDEFAEKAV